MQRNPGLYLPPGTPGSMSVKKTLSSAQILALNANPIELIPAPGAGKIIIPDLLFAFLDYNSAAYSGIAGGEDISLKYIDGSGQVQLVLESSGFIDQTSDQTRVARTVAASSATAATDRTPVVNAAMVLHIPTGEVTTGNSPITFKVFYRIFDVANLF